MAIDIGSAATDRANASSNMRTFIDKANPANGTGTITSVEIWAEYALTDCMVGTFYLTGTNKLKCRASVAIGSVAAGSKKTFTGLSIAVVTDDYIGIYFTPGQLSYDDTGGVGVWYVDGQYIDAGDEATYTLQADWAMSVYGTGVEAAAGRSFGFIIG